MYYCRHLLDDNHKNTPSITIKSATIHNIIFNELLKLTSSLTDINTNLDDLYDNYLNKAQVKKSSLEAEKSKLINDINEIENNIKNASTELINLTENPLADLDDTDAYDKFLCLLLTIEEFITHLNLAKSQLNEGLESINKKLFYKIIPKEDFRDYLINNLASLQPFLNEENTDVKNRCLRLLFISIIDHIKISADSMVEISFK